MATTAKAGGTSASGRAKTATITQIVADLNGVKVEMRYMRRWMYALTACMVLMLGGFGWMEFRLHRLEDQMNVKFAAVDVKFTAVDDKFGRLNERFDRQYELLLQMQQQMYQQLQQMQQQMYQQLQQMQQQMHQQSQQLQQQIQQLHAQQQPPGRQPPAPPTQQSTIPPAQDPPLPDNRPGIGRQAKREDPEQ